MLQEQNIPIPMNEQIVNKLIGQISKTLEKKYQIQPIGVNVGMPGGVVKLLGIHFQINKPLSKENLRRILISSSEEFLSMVNANEDIRPYLENYPFKIEQIDVTLFIKDSKGRDVNHPDIGIASINRGELEYLTMISVKDICKAKTEVVEKYEDAIKASKL